MTTVNSARRFSPAIILLCLVLLAPIAYFVVSRFGAQNFAGSSGHTMTAARTASDDRRVIPGEGIAGITIGMTREEVLAVMGPAEQAMGDGSLDWPSRGVGVILDFEPVPRVSAVLGGDVNPLRISANLSARTAEGLGLKSTEDEITAAYGPAEKISPADNGFKFLSYPSRGIEFKIRNGIVTFFTVREGGAKMRP